MPRTLAPWPPEPKSTLSITHARAARGRRAQADGLAGEARVAAALTAAGWRIHGQRLRTEAGEIDIVAEQAGLLAIIEVKRRATLADAAASISGRQQRRLCAAAAILQGEHPDWGPKGLRFDAWLLDAAGRMQHVPDAFRDQ